MGNVKARNVVGYEGALQAGDFWITAPNPHEGNARRLTFICPCGCGSYAGIKIRDDGQNVEGAWGWDRNEMEPTTTPSIQIMAGCRWHGFLTKGVFVSC